MFALMHDVVVYIILDAWPGVTTPNIYLYCTDEQECKSLTHSSLFLTACVRRSADQVHDVLDEIHEQQDIAQEISDALSQPVVRSHLFNRTRLLSSLRWFSLLFWCLALYRNSFISENSALTFHNTSCLHCAFNAEI